MIKNQLAKEMATGNVCNTTTGCNFTLQYENETFRNALGFCLAITSIMSTLENAIVLIVLCRYKILRTPSNAILLSLAAANFFTGSIVAPLYSLEWLSVISRRLRAVMVTRESLIRIFFGISTITMAFISYDRYLHIRRLHNYKMGRKLLYAGLAVCWLAPVAIASLYLPIVHFKRFIYVEIVSTVFSLVILAAIIVPYGGIIIVLRRHTTLSGDQVTRLVFYENQRKAGRTVAIIVTVYLLMNGPAIINEVLLYSYELDMICAFLVMANSSVNPIIYFYQTPQLKRHAMMFLGMSVPRSRSESRDAPAEESDIMVIVDSKFSAVERETGGKNLTM